MLQIKLEIQIQQLKAQSTFNTACKINLSDGSSHQPKRQLNSIQSDNKRKNQFLPSGQRHETKNAIKAQIVIT